MSEQNILISNPTSLSQRYFSMNESDWFYIASWMFVLVTLNAMHHNILLNLLGAGVCLTFFYKFTSKARLYYQIGLATMDLKIRFVNKGVIWANRTEEDSKRSRFSRGVEHAIPIYIIKLGEIGLAYYKARQNVSCVITGSGSNIASMTLQSQRAMLGKISDSTKRVASRPTYSVGINYVFRLDPYNPWTLFDQQLMTGFPDTVVPRYLDPRVPEDQLTTDDIRRKRIHMNTGVSNRAITAIGAEPVMAMVVTLKNRDLLKAVINDVISRDPNATKPARKGEKVKEIPKLSEAQAFELPIMDIARTCKEGLEAAGVSDVRILGSEELKEFFRGAWDITDMPTYYQDQHQGTLGKLAHWPQKLVKVTKKASQFDRTTHAVLRVTNVPSPSLPHVMRLLHAIPAKWRSISLVGETIRSTGDYFALGRLVSLAETALEAFGSSGGIKVKRGIKSIGEKQEKVSDTSFMHLYNILICISSPGSAALEREIYNVTKDLDGKFDVQVERIKGWTQQDKAVWTARAGINML